MKKHVLSFVLVLLLSITFSTSVTAQIYAATTGDSPLYATNVACTSGASCTTNLFQFAQMGIGTTDFALPYTNSGAFKLEDSGNEYLTWVCDYDMRDWYHRRRSIAHWDVLSGTCSGATRLNNASTWDTVWDPDVVHYNDSLYAVYYTLAPISNPGNSFPGNGSTVNDWYHIKLESFSATDPPVSSHIWKIEADVTNDTNDIEYVKNPNLDVSLHGDVVAVWEEKRVGLFPSHIYARHYDQYNMVSANYFDLDPGDFEYDMFYNPDIALAVVNNDDYDTLNYPVYITFMGTHHEGVDLLVYIDTLKNIIAGNPADPANLIVLATLPTDGNLSVGDPIYDYLYRPRIASHPSVGYTGGNVQHNYHVVCPRLDGTNSFASDIVSYTYKAGVGYTNTVHTESPASNTAIDCHMNYEPCTDVNMDGFEVVWNADQLAYLAGWAPNTPLDNAACSPMGYYEQTILRKTVDWNGNTTAAYTDYSVVPYNTIQCCGTYSPSVAFDRIKVILTNGAPNEDKTYFGFQYDFYDQETYYKLSTYTNTSLKTNHAESQRESELSAELYGNLYSLGENSWSLNIASPSAIVEILDIQGRKLSSKTTEAATNSSSLTINLDNEPAGIYILNVIDLGRYTAYKLISFDH